MTLPYRKRLFQAARFNQHQIRSQLKLSTHAPCVFCPSQNASIIITHTLSISPISSQQQCSLTPTQQSVCSLRPTPALRACCQTLQHPCLLLEDRTALVRLLLCSREAAVCVGCCGAHPPQLLSSVSCVCRCLQLQSTQGRTLQQLRACSSNWCALQHPHLPAPQQRLRRRQRLFSRNSHERYALFADEGCALGVRCSQQCYIYPCLTLAAAQLAPD